MGGKKKAPTVIDIPAADPVPSAAEIAAEVSKSLGPITPSAAAPTAEPKPVLPLPDPADILDAERKKKNAATSGSQRSGRQSTFLSNRTGSGGSGGYQTLGDRTVLG